MLLNNLDPEVAEHPESLVVYGGSGRAARSHQALRDIVRTLLRLGDGRDAPRPVGQARRRVPDPCRRAARPHRELAPRAGVGDVGRVSPARGGGPDDVRADDRGLVDLHRHPGDPAGDVPDVLRRGREALRHARSDREDRPDGRPRGDGRRPAARCDDGGRCHPVRRGRPALDRPSARDPVPRRAGLVARRRAREGACGRCGARSRSRSGCGGTRRTSCRSSSRAARCSTSSPTRPPLTTRSPVTSPPRFPFEEAAALRERDPQEYLRLASESIVAHVRAMIDLVRMGCYVFDYGNNLRGEAYRAGLSDAFTYPGFVPAYIRPLFCRGIGPFRWAVLSGEPADIADDRSRAAGALPRRRALAAVARAGADEGGVPGAPGTHLLARLRRPREGRSGDQRARALGRGVRAGGDREGSPRFGLRRLAVPRDRVDAGRLGRDRRLADPQRAPQHGGGRDVGQRPPRRRRRASATRSTRAWSSSPTGQSTPIAASSVCSPRIRAPA